MAHVGKYAMQLSARLLSRPSRWNLDFGVYSVGQLFPLSVEPRRQWVFLLCLNRGERMAGSGWFACLQHVLPARSTAFGKKTKAHHKIASCRSLARLRGGGVGQVGYPVPHLPMYARVGTTATSPTTTSTQVARCVS